MRALFRSGPARGFTLLEAVLALAILSAAMIVCLEMRAQSMAMGARMAERHATFRDEQAIFEMVTAGLLEELPGVRGQGASRSWQGEHLGRPFRLTARAVTVENPAASLLIGEERRLSDRIVMWRYELEYRGRVSEFMWHR